MRGVSPAEVDAAVAELNALYDADATPYRIDHSHGGYRLVLRDEFERMRDKFYGRVREAKLSPAAIEVLSIVAYNQPVTAAQIDELRGCVERRGAFDAGSAPPGAAGAARKIAAVRRVTGRPIGFCDFSAWRVWPLCPAARNWKKRDKSVDSNRLSTASTAKHSTAFLVQRFAATALQNPFAATTYVNNRARFDDAHHAVAKPLASRLR